MEKVKVVNSEKFIKALQDFTDKHDAGCLYLDTVTEIFNTVAKEAEKFSYK